MEQDLRLKRQRVAQAFRSQRHSLRLSASNIAAVAGFHPWKNLIELLQDLVYQGYAGKELLRQDTELLGIEIVDSEQVLKDLAKRAGATAAVADALRVKDGSKMVPTVQAAGAIKEKAIQEAAKKLTTRELKIFKDGVRSAVDTGFGTKHEDDALDIYEKSVGWPVTERNAEVRAWSFRTTDNNSVTPMDEASPLWKSGAFVGNAAGSSAAKRSKVLVDLTSDTARDNIQSDEDEKHGALNQTEPAPKPFFSILGSVDGIRDELTPGCEDDDDSWVIRQVIVEVKHRMRRVQPTPPLYEQIQTTAYCLMYNVNDADLVQVLRTQERPEPKSGSSGKDQSTLDSWIKSSGGDAESVEGKSSESKPAAAGAVEVKEDDDAAVSAQITEESKFNTGRDEQKLCEDRRILSQKREREKGKTVISVSRVSLDDPIMRHRQQWNNVILPRLRSFVEAVYCIRSDDDKRYRLLTAVSEMATDTAWQILFDECPWLQSCDTAFHNDRV